MNECPGRSGFGSVDLHKNLIESLCILPIDKLFGIWYNKYRKKERGTNDEHNDLHKNGK